MSTIAAISTAPGMGGIAIIRVSGKDSYPIVNRIFRPKNTERSLLQTSPYAVIYGEVSDGERIIDDVLLTLFRAPRSFTGEDCIEISCHGSIYIQQSLLALLIQEGADLAQPGEFTQRAFLNGKMDLSQAEGVADLIASTGAAAHKLALSQMRGGFSRRLTQLREELIHFASLIELELDFSEEDIEFADRKEVKILANKIHSVISSLVNSFSTGNAIKNGIPVVIIGETNAGKSTLLNALFNEEKAIVSDIHGTTRDLIEDTLTLQGVNFRFIDTAGLRKTQDVIENMGIDRTYQKIRQAQIVLWLFDITQSSKQIAQTRDHIFSLTDSSKIIPVANKADLVPSNRIEEINTLFHSFEITTVITLSAQKGEGFQQLEAELIYRANLSNLSEQDAIVTNIRHFEALTRSLNSMNKVLYGLESQLSGDLLAQDIREVIYFLGEITGEISDQDILKNIFSNFCIGK